MVKLNDRPKADGASEVSAHSQSRNGKRGADPPNGKAPVAGRSSKVTACETEAYSGSAEGQAQSLNGAGIQHETTILKIPRYTKGRYTVVVPDSLVRDKRMKGWPIWIMCVALSKPKNWKLRNKWLRAEFGLGKCIVQAAMRKAQRAGYVKLKTVREGQRFDKFWLVRAALDLPWPDQPQKEPVLKGRFLNPSQNRSLNDNLSGYRAISNDMRARAKARGINESAKRTGQSNGTELSSSLPSWVLKEKKKYPRAQDHPKWQEFADWCSTQRDWHGRPGKPNEKGFWTWLAQQKGKWRAKVKTRKDEFAQMPPWKLKKRRDDYVDELNQLWQPVKNINSLHLVPKEKREEIKHRYKAHLPRRDELRGLIEEIDQALKAKGG